ncbi:YbaN family protein [Deinococcus navajonensis]|uniref:YbaN family protein n=1 Tax=Deinococcus navajonensis TaxID=309884 RepID=A0ABV8XS58_9DEIO
MTPPAFSPAPAAGPPWVRPLWGGQGLCGLGTVGLLLPGGPVWFVLAAGAFAKSDPRREAWLLSRPGVGQLVRDYRAGRGMSQRAKRMACLWIALAAGLSVGRLPGPAAQVGWGLAGAQGIGLIAWRVPTFRDPAGR